MNRESGRKLLGRIIDVTKEVGIYDKSFIGFGTTLGGIRPSIRRDRNPAYYERGIIPWDHDMDMCFLPLPPEKKEEYFRACKEAGLFQWEKPHTPRGRQSRRPDGELLWFSVVEPKRRFRSCNWFCFEHGGWLWHTKGKRWLGKFSKKKYRIKPTHQAIAKGTPAKCYDSLVEIPFENTKVNVPIMSGSLLDEWYPGWSVPKKGGASRKKTVCVIGQWNDKSTWRVTT